MKKNKKVYPTSYVIRFIFFVAVHVFTWINNIHRVMPRKVRKLPSPYLVLGNHVGFWDPFVTGTLLPRFTRFVASDAAFKTKIFGFFLTRLGTIPKKKNVRDTQVIRDIIAVIRQGGNVGIFPEAVRNWAGTSFPIDKSIAKLIKLLKVPVVVPIMRGMNLFNPRWAPSIRRAKVVINYSLLFTSEQVAELSEEEIWELLVKEFNHDEVNYQRKEMIPIRSRKRAEHISHALYICPECKTIDSYRCKGNNFHCVECGYNIHIDKYGFFERQGEGELYFDNIRDWYYWEEKFLVDHVLKKMDENTGEMIFKDLNSKVFISEEDSEMQYKGNADISFFTDKIIINYHDIDEEILNFDDLLTINPQVSEKLEIFYKDLAYRIIGGRPGVSALKWEVASNAVWKKLGQDSKLSPYINTEI